MYATQFLILFSILFFSVCGVRASVKNFEISGGFNESKYRVDAEQDPFTSVTLASKSGDAHSTLFKSCLAASRTFEAKFASIETPGGITYTRYVPDLTDLSTSFPVSWVNPRGSVSDIFECASAAERDEYRMFKYSDNICNLTGETYDLNRVPECEGEDVDAVFIGPEASGCPLPSFPSPWSKSSVPHCLLINKGPLTYDDAKSFCEDRSLMLFHNTVKNANMTIVIAMIQQLGYTKSNLWISAASGGTWRTSFLPADWVGGVIPPQPTTGQPDVAYMDYQQGWKLTIAQKDAPAGVFCETPH